MSTRFIKKPIFLIPVIMAAAIGLVSLLAWVALKPINEKAGFNRKFFPGEVKMLNIVNKPEDVIDFAGNTENHIYFKTKNPARIYITDNQLQNGHYINLNIPSNKNKNIASFFQCIVDSPDVYILACNLRAIIKTRQEDTLSVHKFPAIFTRGAIISDSSFALRMVDKTDQIFVKSNLYTNELLKEKNVSEKNRDAGISTDGSLLYDNTTKYLVYVEYYQNEFLTLDTNLNLLGKLKTISSNSTMTIRAEKVSSNIITNLTPKRLVNPSASVYEGGLYVNSLIKADNETDEIFNRNSLIDVYQIKGGAFQGSFYIPNYKNEKIVRFKIINKKIVIESKHYLISHELPSLLFSKKN